MVHQNFLRNRLFLCCYHTCLVYVVLTRLTRADDISIENLQKNIIIMNIIVHIL